MVTINYYIVIIMTFMYILLYFTTTTTAIVGHESGRVSIWYLDIKVILAIHDKTNSDRKQQQTSSPLVLISEWLAHSSSILTG